jgi:dTDP-glucose pyrophosphorylase
MTDPRTKEYMVPGDLPLKEGIGRMNASGLQVLLVVDEEGRLLGTVTDGDIRRTLASGLDLGVALSTVMNASPTFVHHENMAQVHALMMSRGIRHVPVLDEDHRVIDLVDWSQLLGADSAKPHSQNVPVIVMAGGKGTRLQPITRVLPKPLVPIGSKTLIERVMDGFHGHGFDEFVLTLNYKREVIRQYFDGLPIPYSLDMIDEGETFLGTAGSVSLAREFIKDRTFFVSNCDIVVDADFAAMLAFHRRHGAAATVLSVLKTFKIPYGVLEVNQHTLQKIEEKPEYHFLVNSGIYILDPVMLDHMEPGQRVDMPDLLLRAKDAGLPVLAFPYSGQWFDVGQWDQYRQAVDHLERQ